MVVALDKNLFLAYYSLNVEPSRVSWKQMNEWCTWTSKYEIDAWTIEYGHSLIYVHLHSVIQRFICFLIELDGNNTIQDMSEQQYTLDYMHQHIIIFCMDII